MAQEQTTNSIATSQNVSLYPNPNDGNMTLAYTLPDEQQGQLVIYDVMGNVVDKEILPVGSQQKNIILTGLASGIYYYQVSFNNIVVKTDKLIIAK